MDVGSAGQVAILFLPIEWVRRGGKYELDPAAEATAEIGVQEGFNGTLVHSPTRCLVAQKGRMRVGGWWALGDCQGHWTRRASGNRARSCPRTGGAFCVAASRTRGFGGSSTATGYHTGRAACGCPSGRRMGRSWLGGWSQRRAWGGSSGRIGRAGGCGGLVERPSGGGVSGTLPGEAAGVGKVGGRGGRLEGVGGGRRRAYADCGGPGWCRREKRTSQDLAKALAVGEGD